MPVHAINLRGPWEFEWVEPSENGAGKIKMPTDWKSAFGDQSGRVRFTRRFNSPTNLDEHEHVFIVLSGYGGHGFAQLGEHRLGELTADQTSAEFEITEQLQLNNQLSISLEVRGSSVTRPGGLWDLVRLEIRSS